MTKKKEESKPKVALKPAAPTPPPPPVPVKPEVLAAAAYDAYVKDPKHADMETHTYARGNFINGFLAGYAAAKGK